ncbi:MAG: hypothetical protein VW450_08630 [Chloroflexota bacterium]
MNKRLTAMQRWLGQTWRCLVKGAERVPKQLPGMRKKAEVGAHAAQKSHNTTERVRGAAASRTGKGEEGAKDGAAKPAAKRPRRPAKPKTAKPKTDEKAKE